MKKERIYFWIAVAVSGACLLPFSAHAASIDSSQNLLCAPQLVIECGFDGNCTQEMAANVNLPNFFQIDFAAKELSAIAGPENKRTSKIKSMESFDGKLFMQGADDGIEGVRDGLAWSISISQDSGRLVLSASGENVAFVIFGACTPW
jgi:hypothetical protein